MIRKAEGKGMYGRGAAGDPEAVGPGREAGAGVEMHLRRANDPKG
ncbi:hypothetical protein U2I83_18345 [Bacillus amyloliquefaciens]